MELRKLPVYKLVIDENEQGQLGVDYVAVVDAPAIERSFMAFVEHQEIKFSTDEDKQIISGALMIPNYPIYRNGSNGECYVYFDKQTIENIALRFFKNGYNNNVNKMHNKEQTVDKIFMFESFIINSERGINTPKGFAPMPDGTWFASYKVEDSKFWVDEIKSGNFKGFSVEGMFDSVLQTPDTDETLLEKIKHILNQTLV